MAVAAACSALTSALGAKVTFPGSALFKESTSSYLSALEGELSPACIVKPSSTDDVVSLIQTVKPYTDRGGCTLAVRAGGNQPFAGAANVAGGVTIDLRDLTQVDINQTASSVSIAAGANWGDVYEKLGAAGLGVAGGRASRGGIGGLALGGGFSFFSSQRGFVSDNVVNFDVVLADGRIVKANANENKDLWTALKGGSNNFGIVTSFDFATFEQGGMWGGDVLYAADQFPKQLEALAATASDPKSDPDAHLLISVGYAAIMGGFLGKNSVYYAKPDANPQVLQPFTSMSGQIETMKTLRPDTLKGFADEQSKSAIPGQRLIYWTTTVQTNSELLKSINEKFTASAESLKSINGIIYSISFQPLTPSFLKAAQKLGPNSFGLDPNGPALMIILLYASWSSKADDQTVKKAALAFIDQTDHLAQSRGLGSSYKLLTYASPPQDVIGSYGKEAKASLQAVSKKYDPNGFFQKVVSGGFKLFNVGNATTGNLTVS